MRGQKHNRIFTTEDTEFTEESQRPQDGCSYLKRLDVFAFPHYAGRANCTPTMTLSRSAPRTGYQNSSHVQIPVLCHHLTGWNHNFGVFPVLGGWATKNPTVLWIRGRDCE